MKKMILGVMMVLVVFLSACAGETDEPKNTIEENDNWKTRPVVTITVKDYGEMTMMLYPNIAPVTVRNFINYVINGDYTDSSFHRVIDDFMIQGGIVDDTVCEIYGEFGENGFENPLLHTRGVVSMARTPEKNSQTSQFFIVQKDSNFLDGKYATFGELLTGFDVLDMIAEVETDANDAPLQQVVIEEMTIDLDGYEPGETVCYE